MSVFKDKMNRWRTESLFLETNTNETDYPSIYCLTPDKATEERPCLRTLYIETADVTEYEFATKYLGGWDHWQIITNNKSILAHVSRWRAELEVKVRSESIKEQIKLSKSGNPNASKWLAEGGWKPKRAAGKPSKEEVARETQIQTRLEKELEDDFNRIFN